MEMRNAEKATFENWQAGCYTTRTAEGTLGDMFKARDDKESGILSLHHRDWSQLLTLALVFRTASCEQGMIPWG